MTDYSRVCLAGRTGTCPGFYILNPRREDHLQENGKQSHTLNSSVILWYWIWNYKWTRHKNLQDVAQTTAALFNKYNQSCIKLWCVHQPFLCYILFNISNVLFFTQLVEQAAFLNDFLAWWLFCFYVSLKIVFSQFQSNEFGLSRDFEKKNEKFANEFGHFLTFKASLQ